MIKLFAFMRRRDGVPVTEFHEYWLNGHGRRLCEHERARHVRRYEQNHRTASSYDLPGRGEPEFDGVAVQWFDDVASFHEFASMPTGDEASAEDQRFFDTAATTWLLTSEADVIVGEPGGLEEAGMKFLCIVGRNQTLERAAFHRHWRDHHGGLFRTFADLNEPLLGYHQNHRLDADYERGGDYDGVTEQWFTSVDAWQDSLRAPAMETEVGPDVAYMLDPARIHYVLCDLPDVLIG